MKPLDLNTLERLLDTHGPDPMQWPESQRRAMHDCIAADVQAADLLAQARDLQAMLAVLPEPVLPAQLMKRVLHSAPQVSAPGWWATLKLLWAELGGMRLAAPVLACGLLLGVAWPLLDNSSTGGEENPDLISIAQLGEEQWQLTDLEITP